MPDLEFITEFLVEGTTMTRKTYGGTAAEAGGKVGNAFLRGRLCACALFGAMAVATAFSAPGEGEARDGLAAIRALKIDHGRIAFAEFSASPTLAMPKGNALATFRHIPL